MFEASLRLLHPVMPFITEEIWHATYDGKPPQKSLALAAYPQPDENQINRAAEADMAVLQDLIVSIRNLRAELKVEQKQKAPIQIFTEDAAIRALFDQNQGAIERLASVEALSFADTSLAKLPNSRHTARFDVHVVFERKIDVAAETTRQKKDLEKTEKEIANLRRQLGNEQFLAKAPAHVVENMRKRLRELEVVQDKIRKKLEELGSGQ
jgi:valyl-tRNA synthetase